MATTPRPLTPAQEIRILLQQVPATQARWAGWLGVAPNSVSRWMLQARRDDGDTTVRAPGAPPSDLAIRTAKLITLAHRAAPGMLTHLIWPAGTWIARLGELQGTELVAPGELTRAQRAARRPWLDGADLEEDE